MFNEFVKKYFCILAKKHPKMHLSSSMQALDFVRKVSITIMTLILRGGQNIE
jgi:hypothetical protein